jgi:hypothetical protein
MSQQHNATKLHQKPSEKLVFSSIFYTHLYYYINTTMSCHVVSLYNPVHTPLLFKLIVITSFQARRIAENGGRLEIFLSFFLFGFIKYLILFLFFPVGVGRKDQIWEPDGGSYLFLHLLAGLDDRCM